MLSNMRVPEPEPPALVGPPAPKVRYYTGLDLGQASDFSALVVVERNERPDPVREGCIQYTFDVRHLHRWYLKTPYPTIVDDVKKLFAAPPLKGTTLVIDGTGVGRPVVDMFRAAAIEASLRPYTITAGEAITSCTVAKKHLVGAVQSPLSSGRLRFAAGLALTPTLAKELETFQVTVDERTRNESFCFVAGTQINTRDGAKSIENVTTNDYVQTRVGYRAVMWSGITKYVDELSEVRFSNGAILRGTPDHRVWTENRGWVQLDQLQEGDVCLKESSTHQTRATGRKAYSRKPLSSTGANTVARRAMNTTSARGAADPSSIAMCGSSITRRQFPTGTTFTTPTEIRTTITRQTLNASPTQNMRNGISNDSLFKLANVLGAARSSFVAGSETLVTKITGKRIALCRALNSINLCGHTSALSADATSRRALHEGTRFASAQQNVARLIGIETACDPQSPAVGAVSSSIQSTRLANTVRVVAPPRRVSLNKPVPVFDLSVQGQPEFFANGILCHNSAWRTSAHDDLVLSLALALFVAAQPQGFVMELNL